MFDTVVVGYDGTPRSDDALALGRRLARLGAGRVIAASVYRHLPLAPGSAHAGTDVTPEDAKKSLAAIALRFGEQIEVRPLSGGSAARALHELAGEEHADLIVVGSTGRGSISRTLPGTTADRLMHGSSCPVAVAPRGYEAHATGPLERIGAAFCEEPEAQEALDVAAEVARAADGTLEVIGAFDRAPVERVRYGTLGTGEVVINAREAAEADLEDAAIACNHTLKVRARLLDGPPAEVLVRQAVHLDLLVMGSRAYGPFGRVLLGSVSHAVMLQCPAPVLVVPRGARSRANGAGHGPLASAA